MTKRNTHEKLTDIIYEELKDLHYVDWVKKNVKYNHGENDVLASVNKQLIYYEVKSNHHPKAYKKAIEQIRRFQRYNPGSLGVYVTPTYRETFQ